MEGVVNRDRQRLPDTCEQAKILANIWEIPMGEKAKGAISNYVKILLDKTQWRDVNRAESEISAKMIWQHQLGLGNRASNKHWCGYVRASRRAYTAAESPASHQLGIVRLVILSQPCYATLHSSHAHLLFVKAKELGYKGCRGQQKNNDSHLSVSSWFYARHWKY